MNTRRITANVMQQQRMRSTGGNKIKNAVMLAEIIIPGPISRIIQKAQNLVRSTIRGVRSGDPKSIGTLLLFVVGFPMAYKKLQGTKIKVRLEKGE